MENYAIDYIKVYRKSFVIGTSYTSRRDVFSILSPFNIDSCISSRRQNCVTVVLLPEKERNIKLLQELLDEKKKDLENYYASNDYSYIEIGGLFVGGGNGLANVTLDILRKNKINIEYQLMNPSRYCLLIKPRHVKKAITKFILELGVRDSVISIL